MANIYLGGHRLRLDPSQAIGKGGEADIYDLGDGRALKLFKTAAHPDFAGFLDQAKAAEKKIAEHQHKLPAFPKGLPRHVIVSQELAKDQNARIVGYAMPLVKGATELALYAHRNGRQGVASDTIRDLFLALHDTVRGIHAAQVVIGDFNDLNVLAVGKEPFLIDADSFQWGTYLSSVFTALFVDPLLCDPRQKRLSLARPHGQNSDWYAFAIMLMRTLLFAGPYDGIYLPADPKKRLLHDERPLHRVSVFHSDVRYPKPAMPLRSLSDDLLHQLERIFVKDERGIFPRALIERMRWTMCDACGAEHARDACPVCAKTSPLVVKQTITVRGRVTATRIFTTRGAIITAAMENGKPVWVEALGDTLRRESGLVVVRERLDPRMRIRTQRVATCVGHLGQIRLHRPGGIAPERIAADEDGRGVAYDANASHVYWIAQGSLFRDGQYGPVTIGNVFRGQTRLWVGPEYGFGFARAGELRYAFLFDANATGINDRVVIPAFHGQLMDAWCRFARDRFWFGVKVSDRGVLRQHLWMLRRDGTVEAAIAHGGAGDHWIASSSHAAAVGSILLVPTDDGIVRVEATNGTLAVARTYPDTELFVDADTWLLSGPDGLYAVHRDGIVRLVIG